MAARMLALTVAYSLLVAAPDLSTTAERTGFAETGPYDEAVRLCHAFEATFPGKARCSDFGTTPEGRPMVALVVSADGALSPDQAREKSRPAVLIQGGIHAGEIEGKDAGFSLFREMLRGKAIPDALAHVTVVFVPVFNIDGHERVSAFNRPNQNGPKTMGWRVTAQNLNLNRDYVKADAPEMRAMLRLLQAWDPILIVDLHTTDGAKFQHDVSVLLEPKLAGPPRLRSIGAALTADVVKELTAEKHLPIGDFYPSFVSDNDPASGFAAGVAPPRFSQDYWAYHNRFGVLVETHSWKTYAQRVRATRDVLASLLQHAARDGGSWVVAAHEADKQAETAPPQQVVLAWQTGKRSVPYAFQGVAYSRVLSEVSGGLWTRFDDSKPETWNVPFFPDVEPALTVQEPGAGYLVPAALAQRVSERLALHGVKSTAIDHAQTLPVEVFRATEARFSPEPFEGHTRLAVKGAWAPETRTLAKGSLFVPIGQAERALLEQILEPNAPDSLCAWGELNAYFEQKEFMEDYVEEELARKMMAQDPKLAEKFRARVAAEPEFAKSPHARLDFFYRASPYWDERVNLYPIFRTARAP
jgi:hypothetical protein